MAATPKEIFKNIRRIQIYTSRKAEDLLAGAYHSAFKGQGMEFEDVREYQVGDEVRSIDWNVTARFNHPFVKSFKEERELTVMLMVDVSASARFGTHRRLKSELIAEIGALLAFSAIKNSDKVGLILFSSEIEKTIPPSKGVRHVLRVIRELLAFEPKHTGTDIASALSFLSKVQRRTAVTFLISDFISEDFSHEAALASKRHDLVSIAVHDDKETHFPKMGLVTLKDLESGHIVVVDSAQDAVRKTFAEHSTSRLQELKKLMNQIGAGLIDIHLDSDYTLAIQKFLKTRERRRR